MDLPGDRPLLRIGELSRRLGVSGHVLRAGESRYGFLQPVRSAGGFRLYSEADEMRVRRMQAHLAGGLSAAEAARTVLREDKDDGVGLAPSAVPDLARARPARPRRGGRYAAARERRGSPAHGGQPGHRSRAGRVVPVKPLSFPRRRVSQG